MRIAALIVSLAAGMAVAAAIQPDAGADLQAGKKAIHDGHYDQAEPPLKAALAEAAPGSAQWATAANELCKLYRLTAQYDPSEAIGEKALAAAEKAAGPNDLLTAAVLENLGELNAALAHFSKATTQLQQALDIRTKVLGEEDGDTADTMTNLGGVDLIMGRYDLGEKRCARAVEIEAKALKPDDPRRAWAWDNLALADEVRGRLSDCQTLLKQSLDLRTSVFGEDHPDVAQSYDNLGWLYLEWEDIPRSRRNFKLAEFTRENALGADHPDTVEAHGMWLSESDANRADPDKLVSLLKKDCAALAASLGPDHPTTVTMNMELADAYDLAHRPDDEETALKQALAATRKVFGGDSAQTAGAEARLAWFYTQSRTNVALADKLFQHAISTMEKTLGNNCRDLSVILNQYGALLTQQNRSDEAAGLDARARQISDDDKKLNPHDDLQGPEL